MTAVVRQRPHHLPQPVTPDLTGTPLPLTDDGTPPPDPADLVDAIDRTVFGRA
ncbi:MAG: hypothetical protein ACRC35_01300 [Angustibacter sp.]